jgi:hypothetical protein
VNLCRRSGRSSPAAVAAVAVYANTAYLSSLRAEEESLKRGNSGFEPSGERRCRNIGAVSAGGDEILLPPFSLVRGCSRHLHGCSRSYGC